MTSTELSLSLSPASGLAVQLLVLPCWHVVLPGPPFHVGALKGVSVLWARAKNREDPPAVHQTGGPIQNKMQPTFQEQSRTGGRRRTFLKDISILWDRTPWLDGGLRSLSILWSFILGRFQISIISLSINPRVCAALISSSKTWPCHMLFLSSLSWPSTVIYWSSQNNFLNGAHMHQK